MKEKIKKLIEELEERESYLDSRYSKYYESEQLSDYYLGKWYEVNMIKRELQEILNEE